MKRAVAVSIVSLMVLGGGVAGTGQAKARRVKVERQDSAGYVGARGSNADAPVIYVDEATFETERYERDVSVTIEDRTGQPVAAVVRQDADGDGTFEVEQALCGATTEPVAIAGGAPVVVKVQPGPCADGTPAVMTSGSIKATFTGYAKPSAAPVTPVCAPGAPREISHTYVLPAGTGVGEEPYVFGYFQISADETVGGATFRAGCGEGRIEVTLADETGLPARGAIAVDADGPTGDAPQNFVAEVCGATPEPVAITPGAEVTVFVLEGPCSDGTPAAATRGTVTATLSGPAK